MLDCFQDYAESVRTLLDSGFTDHLTRLLGDMQLTGHEQAAKVFSGGKRIRGSLLCLVTAALGGAVEDALSRAIAVELIQTATLIHDDFVDQHEERRNSPALWTLEGARKAVLLGDVIFASAIYMMSELGREDGRIVSRAIAEVSAGAYQEPLLSSLLVEPAASNGDASFYEKIIYLKTGVLFGAACRLGAVAAGTDGELQQKWQGYGLKIGEAYQIADDLSDVEQHLLARTITRNEMISLAPALLFFEKESRPHIREALRRESSVLKGQLLAYFHSSSEAMKSEIDRRLRAAVSGIKAHFPDNEYGLLLSKAPWDIIRMFNTPKSI